MAFDAKLWIWWDSLDFNASQLEAHLRLSLEGERLEATYEAIILSNGSEVSPGVYEFDVAPGSTEAKFKEDSMLTVGKIGRPGMPLERVSALVRPDAPAFPGAPGALHEPVWSALKAELRRFDRVGAKATVALSHPREPNLVRYLIQNSVVDLLSDIVLLEAKKPSYFDWSETSSRLLTEIGNPSIAIPDQNAADAMGISPTSRRGGRDPISPAARVLWDASALSTQTCLPRDVADSIAKYVCEHDRLNASQASAVLHGAEKGLTVIWGPPGTGKTNTLAALLHGLVHDATTRGHELKVLVTGPTYKAVEEVLHRTASFLSNDPSTQTKIYALYSRGRMLGPSPSPLGENILYTCARLDPTDTVYQRCITDLRGPGVVLVGCQIRQARRFPLEVYGSLVQPLFDVVVVDECSQVPVSHALSAICGLKSDARLIIAGDHLQMPPITTLDPPPDAAYLVGSIQTYLLSRFSETLPVRVLETNYRSAEDIVDFARAIGYPHSVKAAFSGTALHFTSPPPSRVSYPAGLPWCPDFGTILAPEHRVVTVLHADDVSSQGNHYEARLVAGIVWMLRQSVSGSLDGRGTTVHERPNAETFWATCVGVVTPHRAQRALVIRELESLFPAERNYIDAAVDTVERFQGGERHTIIVTYGVADTDVIEGEEAFLMQLERTNVAVSRAMAKCVVVMPTSLAVHIPEERKALSTAFALKHYVEEFCNIRVPTTLAHGAQTRAAQIRYHRPRRPT